MGDDQGTAKAKPSQIGEMQSFDAAHTDCDPLRVDAIIDVLEETPLCNSSRNDSGRKKPVQYDQQTSDTVP